MPREGDQMARMALMIAVVLALLIPLGVVAQNPQVETSKLQKEITFSKDVAPIVYENCVYCHRPGEAAPFSLLSYKDARPWARAMRQAVVQRQMPPWMADSHYGQYANQRVLTDRQIETIAAWADGGAKEGNPADMPQAPQFADGWQIGTPDLVLSMKDPYTVPAKGAIPWSRFRLRNMCSRKIRGFKPSKCGPAIARWFTTPPFKVRTAQNTFICILPESKR